MTEIIRVKSPYLSWILSKSIAIEGSEKNVRGKGMQPLSRRSTDVNPALEESFEEREL